VRRKKITLSKHYRAALRNRLRGGPGTSSRPAEKLGHRALRQGIDTLDLAKIHGQVVEDLTPAGTSADTQALVVRVAALFFHDVLKPIERTRRATIENVAQLKLANHSLQLRTRSLTAANRRLKIEVAQRKTAERALRLSEQSQRALLQDARHMQQRLRHLSHQVLSAQEAERKEISRELHDEIVQTLTGINVNLASLKIESGISKRSLVKHIGYTQRLVQKSVDIVHKFARDLRPTLLDDLGLIPALHAYLKAFTARTGIQVGFTAFAGIERLSNDKRTVFYRVAQAALVNTAQHARATRVTILIQDLPQAALLKIHDNGRSFDVKHVLDSRRNKRLGLIGMRERVEMVGGVFRVESSLGLGTTIFAQVPFKHGNPK
jgi:signal transduction histidine kinase